MLALLLLIEKLDKTMLDKIIIIEASDSILKAAIENDDLEIINKLMAQNHLLHLLLE